MCFQHHPSTRLLLLPLVFLSRLNAEGKRLALQAFPIFSFIVIHPHSVSVSPEDLQACLGKTEYRRSIARCYAQEAKLRVLRLASAALEVFSLTREVLAARSSDLIQQGVMGNTTSGFGYTDDMEDGENDFHICHESACPY